MSQSVLRRAGKAGVVVAGGVMALSAVAAGTAFADEGHSGPEKEVGGFSPTTPIDGVVAHWMMYHYEKDFTQEPQAILADPAGYAAIHQHMAEMMLGLAPLPADPDPMPHGTHGA
ncbi:hypothetical protein LWC35_12770 [Pseudonocardia kujensis]|uniref:hypothetical protein n=1 Tax=Pseudonocardia kujensis TaxID=1128675 RepID=UPI001E3F9EE5|nr:hypothetical protein [Pseudonocardia kujensis]MCE0763773.1 hypothetical protein [Pseudonocardia kujensis]